MGGKREVGWEKRECLRVGKRVRVKGGKIGAY